MIRFCCNIYFRNCSDETKVT